MDKADFDNFKAMLDDLAALLPPPQALNGTALAIYFRALSSLSLHQVRAALDAHVRDPQRGRFFPKPADVLAQVASDRPGADEAWAIAIRGRDEDASIVWTTEMAEAWGVAKSVLQLGDEVGARVAFRDAYTRLVGEARKAGAAPQWFASLGHDPEGREVALREEARLTGSVFAQLEPPKRGGNPMLELFEAEGMPQEVREKLANIRARLTDEWQAADEQPSQDREDKLHTEALAAESTRKATEYADKHGLVLGDAAALLEAARRASKRRERASMPPESERFAQEDAAS